MPIHPGANSTDAINFDARAPDAIPEAELAELLRVVEEPDPPITVASKATSVEKVRAFCDDSEIRPGRAVGVPVFALFGVYKEWTSRLVPAQDPITPAAFCRALKRLGYRRRHREQVGGDDVRLLGLTNDCARRVREAATQYLVKDDLRDLFDPRAVRSKQQRKDE